MSRNLTLGETPAPGQHGTDSRSWQPRGGPRCVCGAGVDAEPARIHGVDGVVPACPACWRNYAEDRYATVTRAVWHFREGTGERVPDVVIDADAHPEVSVDA